MQQLRNLIITADHLLRLVPDDSLDKLLSDPTARGKEQDYLKLLVEIRQALDFKMAAEQHIIFCHSSNDNGSVSCRLVMHHRDILRCNFVGTHDIDPGREVLYPYGKVTFGLPLDDKNSRFVRDIEHDLVNSVEIARLYVDRIMCKPSFSIGSYRVDPMCATQVYGDGECGVYYGNFTINTTYSQKETDFGKLNEIIKSGVDAYMSRQHNALIETVKQYRLKTALDALTPNGFGKLNATKVVDCYTAFMKHKKSSFYGNTATRFRVGNTSLYTFRAFGAHHIHVKGVPGTVVALDVPPCKSGECNTWLLDQMRRYADFVKFADRIPNANNAVIDLIFDAYVMHGIPVVTKDHVFDVPYTKTEEYVSASGKQFVLENDPAKKYLWWMKWNGRKVKVGLDIGKGLRFFGVGWMFVSEVADMLREIVRTRN